MLKVFLCSLVSFILVLMIAFNGQARTPTFGVEEGEEYVYTLKTATRNGTTEGVNFTLHTIWGDWETPDTHFVVEQGDSWSYVIESITDVDSYYGLNSSLIIEEQKIDSGDIYFWLFHDLMSWEIMSLFDLYLSVFQDVHADNSSYWEMEAEAASEEFNMSHYETFDLNVGEKTVSAHLEYSDKSWEEEKFLEVNLEKGIVTYMEVYLNSSLEWIKADHLAIVCETVEPLANFGTDGTYGFELLTTITGVSMATILVLKKKRQNVK